MNPVPSEIELLQNKLADTERELAVARQRLVESGRNGTSGSDVTDLPVSADEYRETLRRLVQRTAMIVQSEKCVIMLRDRDSGDLIARPPAYGMTDEETARFRLPVELGVSGLVFRTGEPATVADSATDHRLDAVRDIYIAASIRNSICVPLVVEKHDDQSHVVHRMPIGVLHCFNKRYGGEFIDEDVRLLVRLAASAASVIANAQMFQEIFEEKQKLVRTLESLTAGLILITDHGHVGQMNAQARAMFGVPEAVDPVGRNLVDVISQAHALTIIERKIAESHQAIGHSVEEQGEASAPDEITLEDTEGEAYVYRVHASDVRDESNRSIGTVVIFNDITDIRNVERMKTEFVSIVSHELRTPLTPMKGFVRTLLDDENEEWYGREDRREFHQIIEENIDRLSRLIDDLLNVSRIERMGAAGIEMNWEKVDLGAATEAVIDTQKGRSDKHTLVTDFDPASITIESDPDRVQNILQNLVSNAIKYSPNGGEVRITARLEAPSEGYEPGSVLISVRDHGMGIEKNALKRLGEKFYRVDNKSTRRAGGTGIGLFLVKNLVAAHHGEMWAESEGVGKGTTFFVRLPLTQPEAPAAQDADAAPAEEAAGS